MSELKACPFCGNPDVMEYLGDDEIWCGICLEHARPAHWNTRPIEDALRGKLAVAVEALEFYADVDNYVADTPNGVGIATAWAMDDYKSLARFAKEALEKIKGDTGKEGNNA